MGAAAAPLVSFGQEGSSRARSTAEDASARFLGRLERHAADGHFHCLEDSLYVLPFADVAEGETAVDFGPSRVATLGGEKLAEGFQRVDLACVLLTQFQGTLEERLLDGVEQLIDRFHELRAGDAPFFLGALVTATDEH